MSSKRLISCLSKMVKHNLTIQSVHNYCVRIKKLVFMLNEYITLHFFRIYKLDMPVFTI